jgi:glycerol kinase
VLEMNKYVLAIDQGTTGTTSIIFDRDASVVSRAAEEFPQYFPAAGWVEHEPEEIWCSTVSTVQKALSEAGARGEDLAAIGITNQRETAVFWDRQSCEPVGRAIVWQCRRSAGICERLRDGGFSETFRSKTGLVIDPYFSGTKIAWKMENDEDFARLAASGEICFGTVDSWLLAKLTGGRVHATDYTNASRTLMYNIHDLTWDSALLRELGVPEGMLPEVRPSSGLFGHTDPSGFLKAEVPISGIAGDQQAALFGQACYREGMTKNTYGTGSFVLMNTGKKAVDSASGMLTTIAWGLDGKVVYALEGSIFVTGAAIQWLRDGLGLIRDASETGPLAESAGDSGGVYFVPALVGLGAPYWDPYARGAILGITRGTSREQVVRAAVEAMAFQTRDVMDAMRQDAGIAVDSLRVDGGASVMDLLLQFQSDLLDVRVQRPVISETTAMGAAFLAGLEAGYWRDIEEIEGTWSLDREFRPQADREAMEERYRIWRKAVERARAWAEVE